MATRLLDHLRSVFTTTAVGELARATGENTAPIQQALSGLLPAVTAGVINRAQTSDGAALLYRLLTKTPFATDPSLAELVDADTHRQKAAQSGNELLEQLFSGGPQRLATATAEYSGIRPASSTTLTGLVMSILMGFLHKQITSRNLNEGQLAALLREDADTTRAAIPAAFAGLLGWLIGTGPDRPATTAIRPETVVHREEERSGTPWWKWLLYILLPLLLLLLLLRMCNRDDKPETTTTAITTDSSTTATAGDTIASDTVGTYGTAGASSGNVSDSATGPEVRVGVDLPGGRKLNVTENSFNYSLAKFLATKGGQLPKVFTFDNLTFETNSAKITTKARPHVDDLIQIMQAYPSLNIRIEGNTDSTGPESINDPLSAERAEAVKKTLVDAGIQASRVTTRERGETKPVASNKTEAGREKNRRIDVIVTKV